MIVMNRLLLFLLLGSLSVASFSHAAVTPREVSTSSLPAIFTSSPAQERIKAIRVAELDATRALAERIYGVALDSDTVVYDLVLADDQIGAKVNQLVKGAKTTEGPTYKEDGQVWVVKAIKLRTVIEEIKKTLVQSKRAGKLVTVDELESVAYKNVDTVIDALGNGALPGSPGLAKIQAKRAAEVDAYRKLGERMMGVQIDADTTVRDLMLESDKIRARMAQVLKGAKPSDIAYQADNTCEVTMQITLADLYRVVRTYQSSTTKSYEVSTEVDKRVLSEVGYGVARPVGFTRDVISQSSAAGDFVETEIVIRKLIGTSQVID